MTEPSPSPSTPPPTQTLGRRVLKAGGWSLLQVLGVHILRLGSNLIMTRLLLPEAFGLIAMVGILIAGFTLFTDVGINRSVAREPDADQPHFLHVAWAFKIGQGVVVAVGVALTAAFILLLAPSYAPVGSVYADPRLPLLVLISAAVPIMRGLESINIELAVRNLQLQYMPLVEIGSMIVQIIAMVLFAMISPTVWALMMGMLTGALVRVFISHTVIPGPRAGLAWDREIAERIWHFGKWIMGSSAFTFVAVNADRFILAAILNAATFGIYVIAQIWVAAGEMVISRLSDQVGFPAVSEMIRTRRDEVPRLFRKLQSVIDVICVSAFLCMFFGGQLLIDLLYTETYAEAGRYLEILSVAFLGLRFMTLNALIVNLGNSRSMMILSAIRAVSICILLPLAYNLLGLEAALLVVATNQLVTTPYTLSVLRPVLGDRQMQFDLLWLFLTLGVAALVYFLV